MTLSWDYLRLSLVFPLSASPILNGQNWPNIADFLHLNCSTATEFRGCSTVMRRKGMTLSGTGHIAAGLSLQWNFSTQLPTQPNPGLEVSWPWLGEGNHSWSFSHMYSRNNTWVRQLGPLYLQFRLRLDVSLGTLGVFQETLPITSWPCWCLWFVNLDVPCLLAYACCMWLVACLTFPLTSPHRTACGTRNNFVLLVLLFSGGIWIYLTAILSVTKK